MSCTLRLQHDEDDIHNNCLYLFDGITYNLSPMFREATGHRFADLDGMTGAQAFTILRRGLVELVSSPDVYKALNPENGWGDYEGLVDVMAKAVVTAVSNPDAVVVFYG